MRRSSRSGPVLAVAGVAVALSCTMTTQPARQLVPPFWQVGARTVRIVASPARPAGLWRNGGAWFYHAVVSNARDRSLVVFLETQRPSFMPAEAQLASLLARRGFFVVPATTATADVEVALSIRSWGVYQEYSGVIPVTTKRLVVSLRGDLVDLRSGQTLWSHVATGGASLGVDWKHPPEFPVVRKAIKRASEAASSELVGALGRWNGATLVGE